MKLTGQELDKAIASAANDLLFPSESDYPVTAFRREGAGKKPVARGKCPPDVGPSGAKCSSQTLSSFFAPVLEVKDWYGPEETARTERFKALVALLKENLTSPRAYRFGETTIEVYVLGRTTDGDLAGIKTTVVET